MRLRARQPFLIGSHRYEISRRIAIGPTTGAHERHFGAVQPQPPRFDRDPVAGQADDALDHVVAIGRMSEHNHVAVLGQDGRDATTRAWKARQIIAADDGETAIAEGKLERGEPIADLQGRDHAFARHMIGGEGEGAHHQHERESADGGFDQITHSRHEGSPRKMSELRWRLRRGWGANWRRITT